jgi:hypothetical protein
MKERLLQPSYRVLALSLAALLLHAMEARADDRVPAARALFNLGRALMASGRYTEACPKFEESLRLEAGMGTRFNLAYCWERLGRTASAWALYLDVAAEARAAGSAEREQVATRLARDLEPRLSYLLISIQRPSPELSIVRDGVPLGHAAWGVPTPVDPGLHVVWAQAPGKQRWIGSVNVRARHFVYTLSVPELAEVTVDKSLSHREWWGVGLGATGAAGIAAGTLFAVGANERADGAAAVCPNAMSEGCLLEERAEHARRIDQARTLRTRAVVGFAVGGAAAAASALLFLLEPDSEKSDRGLLLSSLSEGWGACIGGVW